MIAEQLQAARAAHWRQNQNPILTLEDAQSWIEQHPLTLFLPRKAQLPVPAPSFVEAVLGESNPTPPHAAIKQARELLIRLIDSGHAAALNLFGGLGEQPDFVAQTEILPFAVAFRGERDWKQPPGKVGGQRVSPLVFDLWTVLEQHGPLTASAARERLGRELTEAAIMRALSELWQTLRVLPALQAEGQPALWALTQHHHRTALTKGISTSQVTAISLLVSMYLQSVYAATNEEIEIFLSPLVSRSRIREAVRGLAATRQIQSFSMDAQTYYFLEGGLPEFAAEPPPERAEPVRRRRPDTSSPSERLEPMGTAPPIPHWTPAANPAPAPFQHAAARSTAEGKVAQPRPAWTDRRPTRSKDREQASRAEKPRWQNKGGAPGRAVPGRAVPGRAAPGRARPSFGARPGGAPRNAPSSGDRQRSRPGSPGDRSSSRSLNRTAGGRPGGRPAGDWKRKPAAPGAGSGPPAAKWRKFAQPGENTPEQRRRTGDRPASGYPLNKASRPDRPARGQDRPERSEGASPLKKPRWDRNRTPGAPFKPQREAAPRANSRGDRSPGGASRVARPSSRPGSRPSFRPGSRPAAPPRTQSGMQPGTRTSRPQGGVAPSGGAVRRDAASRPPYRRNDRDGGNRPGQGFAPPKRRGGAPDTRPNDEGRPKTPGFSKPAPRSFTKSGPRAGGPGKPPDRAGARAGSGTGGYKSAGYRARGPRKDGAKKENRGPRDFKPRRFDSKSGAGRPKSTKFAGSPKSGFRDRNLGKKKPEA